MERSSFAQPVPPCAMQAPYLPTSWVDGDIICTCGPKHMMTTIPYDDVSINIHWILSPILCFPKFHDILLVLTYNQKITIRLTILGIKRKVHVKKNSFFLYTHTTGTVESGSTYFTKLCTWLPNPSVCTVESYKLAWLQILERGTKKHPWTVSTLAHTTLSP